MSAEFAHQKAGKYLCVALHRKVRIRLPQLWHSLQAGGKRLLPIAVSTHGWDFATTIVAVSGRLSINIDGLPFKGWPSIVDIMLRASFHYDFLNSTIIKDYDVKSFLHLIKFFAIRRVNAYVLLWCH